MITCTSFLVLVYTTMCSLAEGDAAHCDEAPFPRIAAYAMWSVIVDDACMSARRGDDRSLPCTVYRAPLSEPWAYETVRAVLKTADTESLKGFCHRPNMDLWEGLPITEAIEKLLTAPANKAVEALLPPRPRSGRFEYWRRFLGVSPDGEYVLSAVGSDLWGSKVEFYLTRIDGGKTVSRWSPDSAMTFSLGWVAQEDVLAYAVALAWDGRYERSGNVWAIPRSGDWRKVEGVRASALAASPDGRSVFLSRNEGGGALVFERRSADLTTVAWMQRLELHDGGADKITLGPWWSADQRLVCCASFYPPWRAFEEGDELGEDCLEMLCFSAVDGRFLGSTKFLADSDDEYIPTERRKARWAEPIPFGLLRPDAVIAPLTEKLDVRKVFGVTLLEDSAGERKAKPTR